MRPITFLLLVFLLALGPAAAAGERSQAGDERYRVVINHEEQYSIWLEDRELPERWKATDFVGTRDESLKHIEEVWTDMRPLSKRRATALAIYRKMISSSPSKPAADGARYRVVINHEEQYSIWLEDSELPEGWEATEFVGTRDESLDHIEEVWTDMRPLSSRRAKALEIYKQLERNK